MKTKHSLFVTVIFLLFSYQQSQAQWSGRSMIAPIYRYGNVGIGTTNPGARLEVHNEGDNIMILEDALSGNELLIGTDSGLPGFLRFRPRGGDGLAFTNNGDEIGLFVRADNAYVGLGTKSPGAQLEVHNTGDNVMIIEDTQNGNELLIGTDAQLPNFLRFRPRGGTGLAFTNNGDDIGLFVRATDGSIGIGTTNIPAPYKMAIDGSLICEEVRVELSQSWPDYVFENDYELMPLEDVAKHIEAKKHLPGIPAASEVASEGIAVGEMQRKMMEKIEELTLYLIQLQKTIEQQQKAIEALQEK